MSEPPKNEAPGPLGAATGAGTSEEQRAEIITHPAARAAAPTRPIRRRKASGYLSLYADTLLGELAALSLEAGGAYIRLLLVYWQRQGALPDDDRQLSQLSGAGSRWRRIRSDLERLFTIGEGEWRNDYVDDQISFFAAKSAEQRRKVGARWAKARAAKDEAGHE